MPIYNIKVSIENHTSPLIKRAQEQLVIFQGAAQELADTLHILGFDVEVQVTMKERKP